MSRPHARNLRKGRWSEPGGIYFITFTTRSRRRLFEHWQVAHPAARCLANPGTWSNSQLLAWVLMPDHFHALVALGELHDLSRTVGQAKALATREVRSACTIEGPVWSKNFHDRGLRRTDDLRAAARYLVANPLRAGLVERVGDYPYWGAAWLVDDTPV